MPDLATLDCLITTSGKDLYRRLLPHLPTATLGASIPEHKQLQKLCSLIARHAKRNATYAQDSAAGTLDTANGARWMKCRRRLAQLVSWLPHWSTPPVISIAMQHGRPSRLGLFDILHAAVQETPTSQEPGFDL